MVQQNTADIQQTLSFLLVENYLAWSENIEPVYNENAFPNTTDWRYRKPSQFNIVRNNSLTAPSGQSGVDLVTHTGTYIEPGYLEKSLRPTRALSMKWGAAQNFSVHVKQHNAQFFALEFFVEGRGEGTGEVTVFNKSLRAMLQWGTTGNPPTIRGLLNLATTDVTITEEGDLFRVGIKGSGEEDMRGANYSVRVYPSFGPSSEYAAGTGMYITGAQLTKTADIQPYQPIRTWGRWQSVLPQ